MTGPILTPRAAREQRTFRVLMVGMACPGSIGSIDPHLVGGPCAAAVSVLESVLDHEVTFLVIPPMADVIETLLRVTGSRVASLPDADYILASGAAILDALRLAKPGSPEFPDTNATVVALVDSVSATAGRGIPVTLSGPGIAETRTVWLDGLPLGWDEVLAERTAELPLGVDVVFITPDGACVCVGRYTRVQAAAPTPN